VREEASDPWTQETLVAALEVVARHYRMIPIDEAVAALRPERALPRSAVVLVASLPVRLEQIDLARAFAQAGTPCALYVTPGVLERGIPPWPLMIRLALAKVSGDTVETYGRRWLLTGPEHRRTALDGIITRLYSLPEVERHLRAEELVESWGVALDALPGLKWYEVESLARCELITVGAAGLTGDSLVRQPLDRAVYEIREARALLEEHLNTQTRHFEYPWEEVSPLLREQIVRAGYRSALAGDDGTVGMNRPGTDAFTLTAHALRPGTREAIRVRLAGIPGALGPLNRLLS
jgi:hypothetical protein